MTGRSPLSSHRPSLAPFDAFNLGLHVSDDLEVVMEHRAELARFMGASPVWLEQVHGNRVLHITSDTPNELPADGALATQPGVVCTVMVADCLPVLLSAPMGRGVCALHAGWRGLAGAGEMAGRGILEEGVAALCEASSCDPSELRAWLGPCIGPDAFEVGGDVLLGFGVDPQEGHPRFKPSQAERWLADLPGLAADRLRQMGLVHLSGGAGCTVSQPARFFSFRRDRVTGRQAACIWIDPRWG